MKKTLFAMEKYLNQLIEDLATAEANPTPEPDFGTTYKEFEKMMLEIEKGEMISSKEMLNVSYEELPAANMLTSEQIDKLLTAIVNALEAKGTDISVPSGNAPQEVIYEAIREHFQEGFRIIPGWTIDFCSGCCECCHFENYCDTNKEEWLPDDFKNDSENMS